MKPTDVNTYVDGVLAGIDLIDSDTLSKELMIKQLKNIQEMVNKIQVNGFTAPTSPHFPVPSTPTPMWPGDHQFDPMYDPNRIIC